MDVDTYVGMGLRILVVSLDYPPCAAGGYGIMCAHVCAWLRRRGHALLVLCAGDLAAEDADPMLAADSTHGVVDLVDDVPLRRTLRSYWDGEDCIYARFRDAFAIEQTNQTQLRAALAEFRPDVVMFWHMSALSLGLITTTARLGFSIVFVIGDDWLC